MSKVPKGKIMIQIFYGEDRVKTQAAIKMVLGSDYEVFEGENLTLPAFMGIFRGTSLFTDKRKILIKDLSENDELYKKLPDFIDSENDVIVWESKFDKRTSTYKALLKNKVKMKEFKALENADKKMVLDVFNVALYNGEKAVKMIEKIENEQDPYMFFGLLATQAISRFEKNPNGQKEKRVLKELSDIDIKMRSTSSQPWLLLKSFLLRVSSL